MGLIQQAGTKHHDREIWLGPHQIRSDRSSRCQRRSLPPPPPPTNVVKRGADADQGNGWRAASSSEVAVHSDVAGGPSQLHFDRDWGFADAIPSDLHRSPRHGLHALASRSATAPPAAAVLVLCCLFLRSPRRRGLATSPRPLCRTSRPPSGLPSQTHQLGPQQQAQAAAGRPESSSTLLDRALSRTVFSARGLVTPLRPDCRTGPRPLGPLLGSRWGCNAARPRPPAPGEGRNGAPGSRKRFFQTHEPATPRVTAGPLPPFPYRPIHGPDRRLFSDQAQGAALRLCPSHPGPVTIAAADWRRGTRTAGTAIEWRNLPRRGLPAPDDRLIPGAPPGPSCSPAGAHPPRPTPP